MRICIQFRIDKHLILRAVFKALFYPKIHFVLVSSYKFQMDCTKHFNETGNVLY